MTMVDHIEWRTAVLRAHRDLTPDIRLFAIEPEGQFIPPAPGSHLQVGVLIGERADTRSYTIVGPCSDGLYRIAVKRVPQSRGGSSYLWSLSPGARLTVSAPRNNFPLATGGSCYRLVAGGIGITPIYGMALALESVGADVRVAYACRARKDLAFANELGARLGGRLDFFVAEEGRRIDFDALVTAEPAEAELYVCGPYGMMEAARAAWHRSGRPIEKLRFETFGNSGRHTAEAFDIDIPRLGKRITVAATETMLEALERAGVAMIHDCRKGECGLCAVSILDVRGIVDHRDVFFSNDEKAAGAKLCTCVSRVAGGGITVDTADRAA